VRLIENIAAVCRHPIRCPACQRRMRPGRGCTGSHVVLRLGPGAERQLPWVRYGNERRDFGAGKGLPRPDCKVRAGELHHPGCDVERCPRCGVQSYGCEHILATVECGSGR
jgi:hypothetical protein